MFFFFGCLLFFWGAFFLSIRKRRGGTEEEREGEREREEERESGKRISKRRNGKERERRERGGGGGLERVFLPFPLFHFFFLPFLEGFFRLFFMGENLSRSGFDFVDFSVLFLEQSGFRSESGHPVGRFLRKRKKSDSISFFFPFTFFHLALSFCFPALSLSLPPLSPVHPFPSTLCRHVRFHPTHAGAFVEADRRCSPHLCIEEDEAHECRRPPPLLSQRLDDAEQRLPPHFAAGKLRRRERCSRPRADKGSIFEKRSRASINWLSKKKVFNGSLDAFASRSFFSGSASARPNQGRGRGDTEKTALEGSESKNETRRGQKRGSA